MAASPLVAGYLDLRVGGAQAKGVSIESFTYAPVDGKRVPVVLTAGAMPNAPGQITLAPTTARELGVGVGSQLQLTGGPQPRTMTVSASDSSRPARTTTMTRARGSPRQGSTGCSTARDCLQVPHEPGRWRATSAAERYQDR